jgi:hypothetical protein
VQRKLGPMLIVLGALSVTACAPVPLVDVNNVQVMRYDAKPLTLNDMEHVIRAAAYKEEWEAEVASPGHIVATKHSDDNSWLLSVDILFTTTDFSIHYKNSRGLDYNPVTHRIARHGRGVVEDLEERIKDTVQDVTPGS